MYFDKLGMTSDNHPWPFNMPPFYPFGSYMPTRPNSGADSENKIKDKEDGPPSYDRKPFPNIRRDTEDNRQFRQNGFNYGYHNNNNRKPRSVMSLPPPENIHGGERAIIMPSIESLMSNFGFERACLLRAICEIHEFPLGTTGFGLVGEMITLFFR